MLEWGDLQTPEGRFKLSCCHNREKLTLFCVGTGALELLPTDWTTPLAAAEVGTQAVASVVTPEATGTTHQVLGVREFLSRRQGYN